VAVKEVAFRSLPKHYEGAFAMSISIYYTVYRVTNKVNGRYYIGKHTTTDPNDKYMGTGTVITRAIQTYGVDAFEKQVLYFCDSEQHAFEVEAQLVTETVINDPLCYNLRAGGKGGWIHSAETREKIRQDNLQRPPVSAETRAKVSAMHKGRKRPPETGARISAANKGRKLTAEARANMSKAQQERANKSRAQNGRAVSAETIEKRKATRAGYRHSAETIEKMKETHRVRAQTAPKRKMSPETTAKRIASRAGYRHSPETLLKCNKPEKSTSN
jgi:hypothetical protein